MNINAVNNSATTLITQAQARSASAAQDLASMSVQKDEVGGTQSVSRTDPLQPILALKGAEQEAAMGAKMIDVEEKTIGRFIDDIA
ncbi:MAG: hypothetical protein RL563_1843 [Pseudomonadota bacterium]